MDYVQGEHREQLTMFPEALEDYLEEDNLVRFIDAFVDDLNLKEMGFRHSEIKETGRPPYNPDDLLKLYIYGYLNHIRTSRKLEKEALRNVEVMWLLKKLRPDDKTICSFRHDNPKALKKAYRSFHGICKKLQLFSDTLVAVDGSKFKACNSTKRNYTQKKIAESLKKIDKHIDEYLEDLDRNDEADEERPSDKISKEDLEEKIKKLKELRDTYEGYQQDIEESGTSQKSLTDPDSRLMKTAESFDVCHNVQVASEGKHNLVVEFYATSAETDQKQLKEISEAAREAMGAEELDILSDTGYFNQDQLKACDTEHLNVYIPIPQTGTNCIPNRAYNHDKFTYDPDKDVYICPAGAELFYTHTTLRRGKRIRVYRTPCCNRGCVHRQACSTSKRGRTINRWEDEEVIDKIKKRLEEYPEKIGLRKQIVEPVFGIIKSIMNQGNLLLRGTEKVNGELSLTMLAYNIRRVINIVGIPKMIAALTP